MAIGDQFTQGGDQGSVKPQVQDQWGRSPGDPQYGQPPAGQAPSDPSAGLMVPGSGTATGDNTWQTPQAGGGAQTWGNDYNSALTFAQQQYQKNAQSNPGLLTENAPEYWAQRITENGGLNDPTHGVDYWTNRMGTTTADWNRQNPAPQGWQGGGGSAMTSIADPRGDSLYALLMQRATQGLDVNRNDPIIRQQTDAFGAQQEQGRRQYLSALAERQGPSANLSAENRASAEQVGQNTSTFQGQLMQNEIGQRRQEIQQALSGALGYVSDQQKLALQQQLAQLDDAFRYAQLGQQGYQWDTSRQDNILGGA